MNDAWHVSLDVNPIPTLLAWDDPALAHFVRRDLLEEPVPPVETVRETGYGSGSRAEDNRHWVGLAVCRLLRRFASRAT